MYWITKDGLAFRKEYKVVYTADDDDTDSEQEQEEKGYTLPEYSFAVECDGEKSAESGQLDVWGWIKKTRRQDIHYQMLSIQYIYLTAVK